MIKHPNVSDGKFDSKSFNIIMNKVVLYLTSKKEDKDSYSIERLYEEMGKDSPISYRDGYIEDLNSITREKVYLIIIRNLSKNLIRYLCCWCN